MLFKPAFLASALAALATAQNATSTANTGASTTQSQSMPAVATAAFNIGNTTSSERSQWCLAQTNNCRYICGGTTSTDSCDTTTLSYSCVCPNGTVPDVSAFIDTIPFFICQATFGQCIAAHPMDQVGQGACTANEQCGTRNATAEYSSKVQSSLASATGTASRTAASAGSSATSGSGSGSSASSASASATGKSSASTNTYTSGALVMVLMAAFKLFL